MNPNGIPSLSPGLPSPRGYPGLLVGNGLNPEWVASDRPKDATPLGLMNHWHCIPRVARSSQPWAERPYPFGVNPIPAAPPEKQKAVERLVDRILAAKHNS